MGNTFLIKEAVFCGYAVEDSICCWGAVALGPIALITSGLPEYEVRAGTRGSELRLTMLRCVGLISRASGVISTRPLGAGPQVATPDGQCLGLHVLEYALRFDAD